MDQTVSFGIKNPVSLCSYLNGYLAVSVAAALISVLMMLPLPRFAGERQCYLFAYHAPIAAVFAIYVFDRAERWRLAGILMRLAGAASQRRAG